MESIEYPFELISKDGGVIQRATTPTTLTLKRGRGYFVGADLRVRASKEGYAAKEQRIPMYVNLPYFGNIIFGGLIGMLIVDPATGAMFSFPEQVHINLEQPGGTSSTTAVPIETVASGMPPNNKTQARGPDR